jgi:hypothetical protein
MTTWKERALAATRGSKFGAVVACALGEKIDAPCFHGKAHVTSDSFVMCDFSDKNGRGHTGAFVGDVDDIVRNGVGLADHLNLTAEERAEFGKALAGWIGRDYSDDDAKGRITAAVEGGRDVGSVLH